MDQDHTISKYDRLRGSMQNVALFVKRPTTIKNVESITGKSETFIVETCRHEELGDYIFIEILDEGNPVRVALPPRVCNAISSQKDSLTKTRRRIAGKAQAKIRKDRGELPGFMKARTK